MWRRRRRKDRLVQKEESARQTCGINNKTTNNNNNNGSQHVLGALFWSWHHVKRLVCAAVFNAHNKHTWSALLLPLFSSANSKAGMSLL